MLCFLFILYGVELKCYRKCECFLMQTLYVVSCVHPVAVLTAVYCMTCSLFMLVENARGDHMEEAYYRAGLITPL